jgi:hypothetical protein
MPICIAGEFAFLPFHVLEALDATDMTGFFILLIGNDSAKSQSALPFS